VTRQRPLLWFGLLAAPFAWAVQLVAGYATEEAACTTGAGTEPVWDVGAGSVMGGISIAAILVAVLGGIAALVSLLLLSGDGRDDDPRGRAAFMAGAGVLASLVFLAAIVLSTVAVASLDACHAG
jgi:hypothetical protein